MFYVQYLTFICEFPIILLMKVFHYTWHTDIYRMHNNNINLTHIVLYMYSEINNSGNISQFEYNIAVAQTSLFIII